MGYPNVLTKFLPLIGGDMSGSIDMITSRINLYDRCIWVCSDGYDFLAARQSENEDKALVVTGGQGTASGASILLYGKNSPVNPGAAVLSACDTSGNVKYLAFHPDGRCHINDGSSTGIVMHLVYTADFTSATGGPQWCWKFSNGIMIVGGATTHGGAITLTFCQPFAYINMINVTPRHGIGGAAVVTSEVMNYTSTYFRLSQRVDGIYQTSIDNNCSTIWTAIGWWM